MTSDTLDVGRMTRAERLALLRSLAETASSGGLPLGDTTSPGLLALRHNNGQTVQRPHTEAMDRVLTGMLGTPNARVMVFSPPQLGKSDRCSRWFPFWWLTMHPQHRIVLASYASSLAVTHGAAVRELVRTHGGRYGLTLHPTDSTKAAWSVRAGGGMRSVGVRGGLSGQSMDLGVIDDPFAGRAEAESPVMRKAVWDWYSSVWSARRQPGTREALVLCMTGDTPVLMADGTERALADIRPGDQVATYENGSITTTYVREWANQGPDSVYRIRMKSGREVRANARHPFLTIDANGHEAWKRTNTIEPGNVILGIGENGGESHARKTAARSPQSVEGYAARTTTSSTGQRDGGDPHPRSNAPHDCATDTESAPTSTTRSSNTSKDSAQSAGRNPTRPTPEHIGVASCASTTTTKPERSAPYFATTAISPLDTESQSRTFAPQRTTYSVTHDEVVDVVPCGVEDVFDVQIERTENFIANGLVSHNTRWHKDDLAGRLLDQDGRVEEGGQWVVLHMPAIALVPDPEKGIYADPLGRAPGEPISHPKIAVDDAAALIEHWAEQRRRATNRDWNALWQGVPFDAEGALLTADDILAATRPAPTSWRRVAVGVDPSGGGRDTAGVVAAGLDQDHHVWWIGDKTARMSAFEWPRAACQLAHDVDATEIVYEKNYGGDMPGRLITQAWDELLREGAVTGLCPLVTPVVARKSKVLRAEPIAQAVKTQRAFFAQGAELKQLADEWQMWEPGSSWSPGALDAGVHAATHLLPDLPRGASTSNPSKRRLDAARATGVNARRRAM